MKLHPLYSYEFNAVLNPSFSEQEQIQNFASLLSDKDRFLSLLPGLEVVLEKIEPLLGYELPKEKEFYIVRAEQFSSFSLPITIEYQLIPEKMMFYLLKEIIVSTFPLRFSDNEKRDFFVFGFIFYLIEKEYLPKTYQKIFEEEVKEEVYNFEEGIPLTEQVQQYYDTHPLF
jgi:hypothetical protein